MGNRPLVEAVVALRSQHIETKRSQKGKCFRVLPMAGVLTTAPLKHPLQRSSKIQLKKKKKLFPVTNNNPFDPQLNIYREGGCVYVARVVLSRTDASGKA